MSISNLDRCVLAVISARLRLLRPSSTEGPLDNFVNVHLAQTLELTLEDRNLLKSIVEPDKEPMELVSNCQGHRQRARQFARYGQAALAVFGTSAVEEDGPALDAITRYLQIGAVHDHAWDVGSECYRLAAIETWYFDQFNSALYQYIADRFLYHGEIVHQAHELLPLVA